MVKAYTIAQYSDAWPIRFEIEANRLAAAAPCLFVAIEHIGSTSIVGLAAKPIIDVLGVVREIEAVDRRSADLTGASYIALGEFGLPGRRYFQLHENGERVVNLHIFAEAHPDVQRHLAFRDYLRCHPAACAEYAALKTKLFHAYPDSIEAYMDGKNEWIKATEQLALSK